MLTVQNIMIRVFNNGTMIQVKLLFTFLLGFSVGAVLAILLFFNRNLNYKINYNDNELTVFYTTNNIGDSSQVILKQDLRDNLKNNFSKEHRGKSPRTNKAFVKPNYNSHVLCVIISSDLSNSFAASKSWAQHCNKYHFVGMDNGRNSNADNLKYLNVTIFKPKHSWHFLCDSLRFLYKFYKRTLQWVIFVHDDVFVIPENLRYYVLYKDFNKPYYLGDISCLWNTHYNTAEAGFVLSRGAIRLLATKFNSTHECEMSGKHWKTEDYYLGKHLATMGVHPEDTRDSRGRGRFHTFTPELLYSPGISNVLTKYFKRRVHPNVQGENCCSDRTITFQGTSQSRIFFYYYLLYFVKPYVVKGNDPNNLSRVYVPSPHVWKKFTTDEFGVNIDLDSVDSEKYFALWSNKISPNELNAILRKLSSASSVLSFGSRFNNARTLKAFDNNTFNVI